MFETLLFAEQKPAFLNLTLFGNTITEYITALVVFFGLLLFFFIIQAVIVARLKKIALRTATDLDDTLIRIVQSLRPPFYSFVAFYFAIKSLSFPSFIERAVEIVLIIWVVYQVIHAAHILLDYVVKKQMLKEGDEGQIAVITFLSRLAKIILWSFGLLFILSNAGVNVTSLIAGLGIGGVAIAFALQNILGDLFSSFAIYFDKPFVPGDFIVVGDKMGVVKRVGIKTTRIRSLQGEEIVLPNNMLTSTTVQNFKRMEERRVTFTIGVTYDTSNEKIDTATKIIKDVITETQGARFDRAHFKSFGDFALLIEVVYYVTTGDYNTYMDINQKIHLQIKQRFEKEKIEFAFPTQTIFVHKSP